jgi:hypothetical protein
LLHLHKAVMQQETIAAKQQASLIGPITNSLS